MTSTVTNPILPGFNPDPCLCRVGDDFYIACSTFEWFPGVQIYHSKDLVNWQLVTRPLDRVSQLNMKGVPNSGGIWAPALSYRDGLFYLIYTNVLVKTGLYKDTPNYLVTAPSIEGPWSEPIYLNSSGFDPSLFHDDDGRKWLVNMEFDYRPGNDSFAGIVLQEYNYEKQQLVGPIRNIFKGTEWRVTEGPHLYKRGKWYYLVTAEGGTGMNHCVTVARSEKIEGPYEVHPENPMITSKGSECPLQKSGHGFWAESFNDEYVMVHLCSRPSPETGKCVLGRETAIQRIAWGDDDWPRLACGGNTPQIEVELPVDAEKQAPQFPDKDPFNEPTLGLQYQTLRVPADPSWLSLSERPGWLTLRARESIQSLHEQSVVGRRIQHLPTRVETILDFQPERFQHQAGLSAFYHTDVNCYLYISKDEELGRVLRMLSFNQGKAELPLEQPVSIPETGSIHLAFSIDETIVQFEYSLDGKNWTEIGDPYDASRLSDEYGKGFTGAFAVLCCHDISGTNPAAYFDSFTVRDCK